MKQSILIIVIALCFFGFINTNSKSNIEYVNKPTIVGNFEPVAVIELFTSQGCSSCPPADKLLAKTINANTQKMVFALSFHVDYWNRLGWVDPFSKAQFSSRQSAYNVAFKNTGSYTPQIIVNGTKQFVGSDADALSKALKNALQTKALVHFNKLTAATTNDNKVKINYVLEGEINNAIINFALVNLAETTIVKNGENGGNTLINNNVVRQFYSKNANVNGEVIIDAAPNTQKQNFAIIAYVQKINNLNVIGAAMASL